MSAHAARAGLELVSATPFVAAEYPGYICKRNKNGQSFKNLHTLEHHGYVVHPVLYDSRHLLRGWGLLKLAACISGGHCVTLCVEACVAHWGGHQLRVLMALGARRITTDFLPRLPLFCSLCRHDMWSATYKFGFPHKSDETSALAVDLSALYLPEQSVAKGKKDVDRPFQVRARVAALGGVIAQSWGLKGDFLALGLGCERVPHMNLSPGTRTRRLQHVGIIGLCTPQRPLTSVCSMISIHGP